MKDLIKILRRFALPYKTNIAMSFVFNVLSAIFSGLAMLLAIPVLEVLFDTAKEVNQLLPWALSKDVMVNNLYFYITNMKQEYGNLVVMPFVGGLMLVSTFLKVSTAFLGAYQIVGVRNSVVCDMRVKIFDKLMNLPLGYYSDERKGDVMSKATGDISEVEGSIMSSIDMLFKNPILIVVSLIFMCLISIKLTLFVLVMLPLAGLIIGRTGKKLKVASKDSRSKLGELLGILEESLSGLRIIKAFNAEDRMKSWNARESEEYKKIMNSVQRRYNMAHPLSEFLGTVVIVLVIWFGAYLIESEHSGLVGASFIAYIGIFYQIINPAKQFTTGFFNVQKGLAAMERIDTILMVEDSIKDKDGAVSKKSFDSDVEYKNVSFSYDGDKMVLDNVSAKIPKGKMVALVGQSGSGKTTFVDLLPRFYDIQQGSISIDGIDIRDMKIFDLREMMGNVNQEAILFNDTFFNNIAFGVKNATKEDVERAAKIANAHDFIMETDDGYQTKVGDRGGRLSGGQRQRISIARAVLKNPDILILDEATSALDTESEKLVQEALENLMKSRTSIVIAHRLSTIRNADLIYVFDNGKIVEQGTHDGLKEHGGIYNKLHELQIR
ncbi:MAG: ABC transporter ATP-binding protein [Bacteroidales bacterium]